jgi:DNA-binding transcriptional regulator YdaS (Cro superfamily)
VTSDGIRKLLLAACNEAGGQRAWAHANGVSDAYVTDVLHGRREPGPSICNPLGYEREIQYRKVKP